ncbi:MBL fold metallo-hydrolase [Microbispora hainanensis]|uniref:MBL fold metallo-hydrolase n=1 Tax=Microbispora hainanensis TaxID=568844 RepID=A0ABZ1SU71_9ACTN|nr:MBL fold metallo-hydrolase [Microbispora hainanensis]
MRLAMLGVRGSTPAPGPEFVRYGGHTSCVAVLPDDSAVPALVLDAGTGLRGLGALLDGAPFRGSVLVTHLHWDHVQGLPFCPPLDHPGARVDLYLPSPRPLETLTRVMSPPHFPITPGGLAGAWRFLPSACGVIEGYAVTVAEITHKGGITHGIRVEGDGVAIAYLPDHAPQAGYAAAAELAADVDLLLHDGQFLPGEQATADAYGHSTVADAVAFAARCGARRLVLTHHAPARTDDALDVLAKEVEVARQGDVLTP